MWTRLTAVVASVALVLASIWSYVDDDLLYASVAVSILGLAMLIKVAGESLQWAGGLLVLLVLPLVQLVYLFANTE